MEKIETKIWKFEEVWETLLKKYGSKRAHTLKGFYCSIQIVGLKKVKEENTKTTYYKNIKYLKEANISLEKHYKIKPLFYFNPFSKEAETQEVK